MLVSASYSIHHANEKTVKIWFYYVLLVITYFSSRGLLLSEFSFSGVFDFALILITRGVAFIYLLFSIFRRKLIKINKLILVSLLLITLLSFAVNNVSFQQLTVFLLLVFYPIGFALIIIEQTSNKQAIKILIFTACLTFVQFLYSVISNSKAFFGHFIVDDPFNGFFGYPRAYAFSYYAVAVAGMIFVSRGRFGASTRKWLLLISIILCLTPVLAGAGRLVFLIVAAVPIILFVDSMSIFKRVALVFTSILLILGFQVYVNYYSITGEIFSNILANPLQNVKVTYFVKSFMPLIVDPIQFFLGLGPGNYMSSSAQQFKPALVAYFNEDLHFSYDADIYQAFNNIIGFIGDVGLPFFLLYYYLVLRYAYVISLHTEGIEKRVFKFLIIFTLLLTGFFQVFDDPYYSISFWLIIGVLSKTTLYARQMKRF